MSQDRIEYVHYRVIIDLSSYAANMAPNDGGVDNRTPEQYGEDGATPDDYSTTFPSDKDASLAKERANVRWEEILRQVSEIITPDVRKITKTGSPTADDPPQTIEFTLSYNREEYVYTYNSEDDPSGIEYLNGEDAITRQIARALSVTRIENRSIYNPDPPSTPSGLSEPQGPMIENVTIGPLDSDYSVIEADITVTEITDY